MTGAGARSSALRPSMMHAIWDESSAAVEKKETAKDIPGASSLLSSKCFVVYLWRHVVCHGFGRMHEEGELASGTWPRGRRGRRHCGHRV